MLLYVVLPDFLKQSCFICGHWLNEDGAGSQIELGICG